MILSFIVAAEIPFKGPVMTILSQSSLHYHFAGGISAHNATSFIKLKKKTHKALRSSTFAPSWLEGGKPPLDLLQQGGRQRNAEAIKQGEKARRASDGMETVASLYACTRSHTKR